MERAGIHVTTVSPPDGRNGTAEIRKTLSRSDFAAAVLISPFPAETALASNPDLPIWIDLNGMHPAEVQLQGTDSRRSRERLLRILALENLLLSRGDMFSTPSRRQRDAVLGELFLLGRLDGSSAGEVPVVPVPYCALPDTEFAKGPDNAACTRIISTGSFNLWFDHKTLFLALESAMDENPDLVFTCTGGATPFSTGRYQVFLEKASSSPHSSRFEMRGWIDRNELDGVYSKASMAVYADLPVCETILGARTRTLDWISRGIPVVCTSGAEVSEDIEKHGLGIVVNQQDPEALRDAFLKLASSPELCSSIVDNQRSWCREEGSIDRIFSPLIEWCNSPTRLSSPAIGRSTVSRIDSPGYLARLFREVIREQGLVHGLYRMIEKIIPPLKKLRSKD
jgi:glycosyltransferase involved in cell wall biosynthesis